MIESRFVFFICSLLGDKIRATREVEKSISRMAMLPASLDSKHFANGSVVKIRNPLEVPGDTQSGGQVDFGQSLPTAKWL